MMATTAVVVVLAFSCDHLHAHIRVCLVMQLSLKSAIVGSSACEAVSSINLNVCVGEYGMNKQIQPVKKLQLWLPCIVTHPSLEINNI